MADIISQMKVKNSSGTFDNIIPILASNATNAINMPAVANGAVNPDGRKDSSPVGNNSIAFGHGSSATGEDSLAIGPSAAATGIQSTAIGSKAVALASSSFALGTSTSAAGFQSTAIGVYALTSITDRNCVQIGAQMGLSNVYGGAEYSVRSDERDKTDIHPLTKALEFINLVEPIQYVRNNREKYLLDDTTNKELYTQYGMCEYDRVAHENGTKKGTRKNVGVKAQQVYTALQNVYGTDNYANIVSDNLYDIKAKGENPPVENKYTVAYSNFVPFLIGAVQELTAQVKTLQSEISALKK